MKRMRRTALVGLGAAVALVVSAGPSLAHECVNASKQNQAAGVQVVIDANTDRSCGPRPAWRTGSIRVSSTRTAVRASTA